MKMFSDFLDSTTVHGFSYTHERYHFCQRIVWGLIVLFGFVTAGIFINTAFEDWNAKPILTTLDTIAAPIEDMQFPTVTVCQNEYTLPDLWAFPETILNKVAFTCHNYESDFHHPLCKNTVTAREDFNFLIRNVVDFFKSKIFQGRDIKDPKSMNAFPAQYAEVINQLIKNKSLTMNELINELKSMPNDYFEKPHTFETLLEEKFGITEDMVLGNPGCSQGPCNFIEKTLQLLIFTTQVNSPMPLGTLLATFAENERETFDQQRFLSSYDLCKFDGDDVLLNNHLTQISRSFYGLNVSLFEIPAILARPTIPMLTKMTYPQAFMHTRCRYKPYLSEMSYCNVRGWLDDISVEETPDIPSCNESECCFAKYLGQDLKPLMNIMRMASRRGQSHLDLRSLKFEDKELKYTKNNFSDTYAYFDEETIEDVNSYLPWCKMGYHSVSDPLACKLFQPVVTDIGICQAYNAKPSLDIMVNSTFTDAFLDAYETDLTKLDVSNGIGVGADHELAFYFFANNLVRKTAYPVKSFYIRLSSASEYFMQNNKIEIQIGVDNQIKVQPLEIVATEELKNIKVSKRRCHFTDEAKGKLKRFKKYSQSACKLECNIAAAEKYCKCLPWYFPNDPTSEPMELCDLYGNNCFDRFFKSVGSKVESKCQCWPDCHDVNFALTEKTFPLDADELCQDKDSIPYRLAQKHSLANMEGIFYKYHKIKKNDFNFTFYEARVTELCKDLVAHDLTRVSVTFASDRYVRTIMDKRVTFNDQLGTLGGTLGLFTGMSILSGIEMLFWLIKFILQSIKNFVVKKGDTLNPAV